MICDGCGKDKPEPEKMNIINVADIVNPQTGTTWREENAEISHHIPVGTLVELENGASVDVTGFPAARAVAQQRCGGSYDPFR